MSEQWKLSGKKVSLDALAAQSEKLEGIQFFERPGGLTITVVDGVRKRVWFEESRGKLSVSIGGKLYFGAVEKQEWGTAGSGGSESDLTSQFPGKVRKILAEEGSIVEEGAPLLMMEAMKMEFSIKAPFRGRVEKWNVEVGAQVSPGQKFLEFKAERL
jgi:3-methylcrotonyl-CoA carboxylase alpha subunit